MRDLLERGSYFDLSVNGMALVKKQRFFDVRYL